MATKYVDQTAGASVSGGDGSAGNPFRSLFDAARGTIGTNDTVEVLPISGGSVYEEATNQNAAYYVVGTDISFDAATRKITTTSKNFGSFIPTNWASATVYNLGDLRSPTTPNGFVYQVTAISGSHTSGGVEPTWPTTSGSTVIDNAGANQITWTAVENIIRVMGSNSNDGQYTAVAVTSDGAGGAADTLTVKNNNNLITEAAGNRIRIVHINPNAQGTGHLPMAFDQGRSGASASSRITWNFHKNEVSAGLTLSNYSRYKWNRSIGGVNEFYCTRRDGSNPSLIIPDSAVVNGNFMCVSAGDATHIRGTVGSLSFVTQYGFGDNDSLGFRTVYVKTNGDNPETEINSVTGVAGYSIVVNQLQYALWMSWNNHIYNDAVWSFGNGLADGSTQGCCVNSRGAAADFNRNVFKYADAHGLEANAQGPVTADHCIFYWCGHRGINLTGNITLNSYNCVYEGTHINALISSGVSSAGIMNIFGCIGNNNEAGAIDKKSASAILNEGYNCWYPRMTASGGALGYVSTANWPKTSHFDIPSDLATTTNNQSLLKDPKFVRVDDYNFANCDFHLTIESPCAGAGPFHIGSTFTDFAGNQYLVGSAARAISMGCYQNQVLPDPIATIS